MKRYHAIEYMGKDEYWLILTNEGESIATIGLKKHLQKSADKEELEDKKLKLDVLTAGSPCLNSLGGSWPL